MLGIENSTEFRTRRLKIANPRKFDPTVLSTCTSAVSMFCHIVFVLLAMMIEVEASRSFGEYC